MQGEDEIVDIVDENNQVVGMASRREAHTKGHIHRALSVLVINSKGQILLQKRSANKSVHPLSWDLSTSEHVLTGESYEDAAIRSVKEELGVEIVVGNPSQTSLQIREYQVNGETVHEKEIVLMLTGSHNGPFKVDPSEVDSVEFFTVEEIERMILKRESFTIWFLEEWENVKKVVGGR